MTDRLSPIRLAIVCITLSASLLASDAAGDKGSVYEGGHRVPAIAWWPGRIKAGSSRSTPAISIDVMPTILSLAGVPAPDERPLDGVDLSRLLLAQKSLPERPLYRPHFVAYFGNGEFLLCWSESNPYDSGLKSIYGRTRDFKTVHRDPRATRTGARVTASSRPGARGTGSTSLRAAAST